MAVRILILSDGRPGHFNLSEGIAAAIARRVPTQVARLTVRRRWPGALVAGALACGLPPRRVLAQVYQIDADSVPVADVIVSAGAETLGASVALARLRGIPNIFYGSLRRFNPKDFALVLTSYARMAGRPRHVVTLKPSQVDPDALARIEPGQAAPGTVGVLIGGDAPGIRFTPAEWSRLVATLKELHRRSGTRFIVTNSRRTPDAVSEQFADVVAAGDGAGGRFIDVRLPGAPRLATVFAQSHALIVTADSSSMLSEACWSRRPTVAIAPADATFNADEASYRRWLQQQMWCAECRADALSAPRLLELWSGLRPMADNPLDALADVLKSRIPALFRV